MTYQESIWDDSPSLKSYTLSNFRDLPQIQNLSEETRFEMEVVGNVLPFKANNFVVEQLIDWNNIPNDPIFVLTFPQKGMLKPEHYEKMATVLKNNSDKKEISSQIKRIHCRNGWRRRKKSSRISERFYLCTRIAKELIFRLTFNVVIPGRFCGL
ncbi:MAG: hypothetical protein V3R39_02385 [Nitrosopumilus sp.]